MLDKSDVGRAVIAGYVRSGYSVGAGARNATNRGARRVTVNGSRAPGAIAVGLAHEEVHANGSAEKGTAAGGEEESAAWEQALRVYNVLSGQDRKDAQPHYDQEAETHRKYHRQFHKDKYCAGANYSDADKCN